MSIICIEGVVENIIFYNAENGYTVFSIAVSDTEEHDSDDEELVCVGTLSALNEGEEVRLSGAFITNPTYGRQFKISSYEKKIPASALGIQKYLGSGLIKGIGEKLAKKIVDKFGEQALAVIEEHPEKLSAIKGITLTKAIDIGNVFKEQISERRIIMALQEYGISPAYAMKIYKKYKDEALAVIKNNPYILAEEIYGIGFKTADAIAYRIGVEKDSVFRIKAGIKYVLSQASNSGHVYLPKELFLDTAAEALDIQKSVVEACLMQLQIDREVYQEKIDNTVAVYSMSFYYAENYTAKKLLELSSNAPKYKHDMKKALESIEAQTKIKLAEEQRTAVSEALTNGVLVITGGPGTGKTTIINTIIKLLKKDNCSILLTAPTGRAAKRMSEATGFEAKTIHRLLGVVFSDEDGRSQKFDRNDTNPLEADVLIIDESSMVDAMLMFNLLKAVPLGTRIILVGDANQLPSVGPGNVLKDIIHSGLIKTVKLTEIFRQAQESAIVMNAHRINNGEYPSLNEKNSDFYFVRKNNIDEVASSIVELVNERLPKFLKIKNKKEIQILTPMRKSQIGINNLNSILQNALNPASKYKKEKEYRQFVFREGDKVMQIKNNYKMQWQVHNSRGYVIEEGEGVFNGDEGFIKKIDEYSEKIQVVYDDGRSVSYSFSQLDELELSYAITIHKSQGSEYRVVIIPVHSGPYMLMNRNLLYTAVTRAKEFCVLVGIPETLYKMVDNDKEIRRFSALNYRLVKAGKFLFEQKDFYGDNQSNH